MFSCTDTNVLPQKVEGSCKRCAVIKAYSIQDVGGVLCTPPSRPVLVLAPCALLRPRLARPRPNPVPVR